MKTNEIITLCISLLSLLFSIYSLYIARKWSHESWQRDSRLPYYREVKEATAYINEVYFTDWYGIFRRPDFEGLSNKAYLLGLTQIQRHIEDLAFYVDKSIKNTGPKEQMIKKVDSVKSALVDINMAVDTDVKRLNKRSD